MKKVIFLAIAAAAALTACSKSEVIDSKYGNDMIGFETYLGRDAQTKASVATTFETAGIYGFYTAGKTWSSETGDAFIANPEANLWVDATLKWDGTVEPVRYWTNADDKYSFVAYAPKTGAGITAPNTEPVTNPAITFAVQSNIPDQIDLLHTAVLNTTKPTGENATVPMTFLHALSRLTVNAKATEGDVFEFRVKKITIKGKFNTTDNLTLATGKWATLGTPAATETTYTFYNEADNETALTAAGTEYAKHVMDGEAADNYLMMIPTNFSKEGEPDTNGNKTYPDAATLTVEYTTYYAGTESTVNTKEIPVTTNFEQGFAYAINLTFSQDKNNEIKFTVTVKEWDETPVAQEGTIVG